MALFVVATPIGNQEDISQRAVRILNQCPVIIGEEFRELSTLLKKLGLSGKKMEQLNEHSKADDLARLTELCRDQNVALVSDCGTPGFCDPGADLVHACRERNIAVHSVPGPSSLMAFLSLCGRRLDEFVFRGFLPANREERISALKKLRTEERPVVLMDTPYRLGRLLEDLAGAFPERKLIVGMDLSTDQERVLTGLAKDLLGKLKDTKAEFLLLLEPLHASDSRKRSSKK